MPPGDTLPPGDNPIAVNKYYYYYYIILKLHNIYEALNPVHKCTICYHCTKVMSHELYTAFDIQRTVHRDIFL
jgi:hypothetical protein